MGISRGIQGKIKSIQSTQKITRAMEMVAASKMRKSQQRMDASTPYVQNIKRVIGHLSQANMDYTHPLAIEKSVQSVGLIVVSSDRGLCGGLNINLFRLVIEKIQAFQQLDQSVKLFLFGKKAEQFFKKIGVPIVASTTHLGDQPSFENLTGTIEVASNSFLLNDIQALYLVCNQFVSRISQTPNISQVLPAKVLNELSIGQHWDYIYEPSPQGVLNVLLKQYVEHLIYHGVIENIACEQSARMLAMHSATDSAGEMIDLLALEYNKARQAAITQEIAEIIGGANAI